MRLEELTRAIQGRRAKANVENPEKEAQKMATDHTRSTSIPSVAAT
jgi:hypothetical protein